MTYSFHLEVNLNEIRQNCEPLSKIEPATDTRGGGVTKKKKNDQKDERKDNKGGYITWQ